MDVPHTGSQVERHTGAARLACLRCPNDTRSPVVRITAAGLCQWCQAYEDAHDRGRLQREFDHLKSLVGTGVGHHDALFGLSGGKDSTAALVLSTELGFRPLAFTFDTGYYPDHIAPRSRQVATSLGVDHEVIGLHEYIRPADLESFRLTADLFDEAESDRLAQRFRHQYVLNRERFSVRYDEPMAYVRTCQLCRRLVVRAYHREALRHGVRVVLLGTNEWAGLSQKPGNGYEIGAIRALRPDQSTDPVYVVHLPFLLGITLRDTRSVLDRIGWQPPADEKLVEANANSCLLSRAAEAKATRMLGFHPDTSRLAREVTVGFLSREQACAALASPHTYSLTVRQVLTRAKILP